MRTKILLVMLLAVSPASAETRPTPKTLPKAAAVPADVCAPIGRTARGDLVYSMKCEDLPPPPPAAPAAEAKQAAPPPEPETQRTGLFGWSYDRR
ncbi:hypothetical protein [Bradyrhizobium sp. I1.14.4]|uniref:hypothetical protein n=1 Tax=unclassified Bradyrhizobium TaxID=2631580 RepID=UPI003D1B8225